MTIKLVITVSMDLMGEPRLWESRDFVVPEDKEAGGLARMEDAAMAEARAHYAARYPGRAFRLLLRK